MVTNQIAIAFSNLAELHLVASEGARLVGKDKLDLSELLVEIGCAGNGIRLGDGIVHFLVHVYEQGLDELYKLDRDVQTWGQDTLSLPEPYQKKKSKRYLMGTTVLNRMINTINWVKFSSPVPTSRSMYHDWSANSLF